MPKTIVIDGIIGWDIYGSSMRRKLAEANGEEVIIELASPGGFVTDGLEIFNIIRNYSRNQNTVTIKLYGLAASMASYIALAGDKLIAEDNAIFMIHNVWTIAIGDYRDFEKTSKEIKSLSNLLAKKYAEKSGKTLTEIQKLMDSETYYYGDEAKKAGFVDEIIESGKSENDDKENMVIQAQGRVKNMFGKMQESEKSKTDLTKAVALLPKAEIPKKEIIKSEPKLKQEVNMPKTLMEFLNQNPEAKKEYDSLILQAKEDGRKEEKEKQKKNAEVVKNFLDSSEYPDQIKAKAIQVITGESTIEALNDMASMYDMFKEKNTSNLAKEDSENTGDTLPLNNLPNQTGEVESETDYQALIAKEKGGKA